MKGIAVWITGLPGSGKSTIADVFKNRHPENVLLRMDEFRSIVTPEPGYSDSEREIVYRSLVFCAMKLTELGHNVIIDATGSLRKWRNLARQLIPRYAEVYLRCPVDICIERESKRTDTLGAPKNIYRKGADGWPVPGVTAPYEEPDSPEVIIENDKTSPEKAAEIIEKAIAGL
jgi:adenylylsulfate kinase